jgi:hypothetical protein
LLEKDRIATPVVRINAHRDEMAIATAKTFLDQHDVELWEDGRLVSRMFRASDD